MDEMRVIALFYIPGEMGMIILGFMASKQIDPIHKKSTLSLLY
jgi:hypothetical protein